MDGRRAARPTVVRTGARSPRPGTRWAGRKGSRSMTTVAGTPVVVGVDSSAGAQSAVRMAAREARLRHRPRRDVHAFLLPADGWAATAPGACRDGATAVLATAVNAARRAFSARADRLSLQLPAGSRIRFQGGDDDDCPADGDAPSPRSADGRGAAPGKAGRPHSPAPRALRPFATAYQDGSAGAVPPAMSSSAASSRPSRSRSGQCSGSATTVTVREPA